MELSKGRAESLGTWRQHATIAEVRSSTKSLCTTYMHIQFAVCFGANNPCALTSTNRKVAVWTMRHALAQTSAFIMAPPLIGWL